MRRITMLLMAMTLLAAACGDGDSGGGAAPTTSTVQPTTTSLAPATTEPSTTTTTTTTTAPPTTTLPEPPDESAVAALAWGLFCRDLEAAGWDYVEAVAYWNAEGRPARMDADENGIPCETVYAASEVAAYWGDPLPTGQTPGPGSGWSPTTRQAPVEAACCGTNNNGPVSPPLPPATGAFPDDGAYAVRVTRAEGQTDELQLEIRRWLPCSEQPERCSPDLFPGDIYADLEASVVRSVSLDGDLTVVLRPIGKPVDDTWTESPLEGDGAALARLLERIDAAAAAYVAPEFEATGGPPGDLLETGAADPTFPYGPAPLGEDWGSVLSYRGPESSYLTSEFYAAFEWDDWMYGWWCTLEIVDGEPILYIWAGAIAG